MLKFRWETEFKETEIGEIPRDWEEKKVGDLGDIGGGTTPSTKIKDYWNGNIPWLTPKDLANYNYRFIESGERNITEIAVKDNSLKIYPKGTVLLTSRAPIGYVAIAKNPITTNQGFKNIIPNKNANNEFLYYFLIYIAEYLRDISGGSTFGELTKDVLKEVKIPFPSLSEQSRIAAVLSWFDDLIENKKRQNEILEKTAMAIFKSWFVDFEPFKNGEFVDSELGKIPKGWEVTSLSEICDFVKGKKCNTTPDNLERCHPYLLIDVFKTGIVTYWTSENEPYIHENNIVIVADGESSGKVLRYQRGILGSTLLWLKLKNIYENHLEDYIYCMLRVLENEITDQRTGSAIPHIDKNYLAYLKFPLPLSQSLKKFGALVEPLFQKIILNQKQIMTLRKVRDTLLPLLVMGKLRVIEA